MSPIQLATVKQPAQEPAALQLVAKATNQAIVDLATQMEQQAIRLPTVKAINQALIDLIATIDATRDQASIKPVVMSINQALVDLIQHLDGSAKLQADAIRDALQGLSIEAPAASAPATAPWRRIEIIHEQDRSGVITKSVISRIE